MNNEKVKEIKKALEQQGNCGIMYEVNKEKRTCKFINYNDILTLINDLESENEALQKRVKGYWERFREFIKQVDVEKESL